MIEYFLLSIISMTTAMIIVLLIHIDGDYIKPFLAICCIHLCLSFVEKDGIILSVFLSIIYFVFAILLYQLFLII